MKMFYFCHELTDVFSVCCCTREEKCDSMLLNRNSATVHVEHGGMIAPLLDGSCAHPLQKNYIPFKL